MVEGARLESVYRGDSIVGSNPTVSANNNGILNVIWHIIKYATLYATSNCEVEGLLKPVFICNWFQCVHRHDGFTRCFVSEHNV